MSTLTEAQRRTLPASAFALPDKRAYPIHDEEHARYALQELSNASMRDQATIRNAIRRRYPQLIDARKATAPKITRRTAAGQFAPAKKK